MNNYLILTAAIVSAFPIIMVKKYTTTDNYNWILLAAMTFMTLLFVYIKVVNRNNLSAVGPLIKIIEVIIIALAGFVLFSEKMEMKHIIGIGLGLISIYLLSIK